MENQRTNDLCFMLRMALWSLEEAVQSKDAVKIRQWVKLVQRLTHDLETIQEEAA